MVASSPVLKAESQEENLVEMELLEGREIAACLVIERAWVPERRPRTASADLVMSFIVRSEPCSKGKCVICCRCL